MNRAAVTEASRIVVKVGSSSLTTAAGGIDPSRLRALVDSLAARRSAGAEVVLVSSGAIAAGLSPLKLRRRPRDLASVRSNITRSCRSVRGSPSSVTVRRCHEPSGSMCHELTSLLKP